jgi:hypothetical protein
MKKISLALLLPVALFCAGGIAPAQPTSTPAAAAPTLTAEQKNQAGYEKHTREVVDALKLDDASRAAKVQDIMMAQFATWKAWHTKNDVQLKDLWAGWSNARNTKNQTNIDNAVAAIEALYASIKPQHAELIAKLAAVLTPAQIETVEDTLTINKVRITFKAYGEIFPGLKDEQKAFILKKLKAAREEAIDAGDMKEKSSFFKMYKDQIEAYLTAQGYDVKQSYKDFGAKQKTGTAAKKAAAQTDVKPADSSKEKE